MKTAQLLLFTMLLCLSSTPPSAYSQETSSPDTSLTERIWSMSEVFNEAQRPAPKKVRYCNGGRFKPCVCWNNVSRDMRYRPALKECGGKAAIILSGKYVSTFSAVVRDNDNRDRWPSSGFNGCSASLANSANPPASCSAFKAQNKLFIESPTGRGAKIHCLGATGYSSLFKRVSRVTVKLADKPGSSDDPLVRWCLRSPSEPLN
jgi:hypothetical protein